MSTNLTIWSLRLILQFSLLSKSCRNFNRYTTFPPVQSRHNKTHATCGLNIRVPTNTNSRNMNPPTLSLSFVSSIFWAFPSRVSFKLCICAASSAWSAFDFWWTHDWSHKVFFLLLVTLHTMSLPYVPQAGSIYIEVKLNNLCFAMKTIRADIDKEVTHSLIYSALVSNLTGTKSPNWAETRASRGKQPTYPSQFAYLYASGTPIRSWPYRYAKTPEQYPTAGFLHSQAPPG